METQVVTITVITRGQKCEMNDNEIINWYQTNVSGLFNQEYGKPRITVSLNRITEDY